MFGLFKKKNGNVKKKRREVQGWEKELIKNTINKLPLEFRHLEMQVNRGLLAASLIDYSSDLPGYVIFSFNPDLINEFENRKAKDYKIRGLKVYDAISEKQLDYVICVYSGVISGYIIEGSKNYDLDINQISTSSFFIKYLDNSDFKTLSKVLNTKEIKMLNPGEVYEVPLGGKTYFHILDLEDGDFIGMDTDKVIYKITHDPAEIAPINKTLEQVFDGNR